MTQLVPKASVDPAILRDIQSIEQSAIIEMFVLDTNGILDYQGNPMHEILRFHAGTNEFNQEIVWGHNNDKYIPLPVEAEGFDVSVKGTLPRPKIRIANTLGEISGIFNASVLKVNDLIGAKITRKRTYAKYLNAQNFINGNPNADPNKEFPDDVFYIEQKTTENRYMIEWELVSSFDLSGILLPRRQVIQNSCHWQYKSAGCDYNPASSGTHKMFTIKDVETTDQTLDVCSKTLSACKARWGATAVLPFGGFPGARRYE